MGFIEIREVDDWTAVYKDGKKVWENHSCPLTEGLRALGIGFDHKVLDEGDFEFDADSLTIKGAADERQYAFPETI